MYWKITPYETIDADYCVMPAGSDADHYAALKYGYDRLESGWDQLEPGQQITVTIKLCEGDMPQRGDD